jgi:hypothetical protein
MAAKGWLIGGSANASSTERPPSGGLFVCPDGMRLCRRAAAVPVRFRVAGWRNTRPPPGRTHGLGMWIFGEKPLYPIDCAW